MQHRITTPGPLHDDQGRVREPGYATDPLLQYDRKRIKASRLRIKEWDYYIVMNDDYGVAFTVADNAYLGFVSVTFFDFKQPMHVTASKMKILPLGRFGMPASSQTGDVIYQDKRWYVAFRHHGDHRILDAEIRGFYNHKELKVHFELTDEPDDSMVIATPFDTNPKAFYYNRKINAMTAKGFAIFDGKRIEFKNNTFGTLDWGRGVWTYDNTWYWGSASGIVDGKSFGFNVGYGFGDTSAATENMVFVDGVAHKLDAVTFEIPTKDGEDDFLSPWRFTSSDGRFELDFEPIHDRADKINVLFLVSDQHQTFGRFNGTVTLDDGRVLNIKNLLGFAEKVHNKW